jgi:hypothetical protein
MGQWLNASTGCLKDVPPSNVLPLWLASNPLLLNQVLFLLFIDLKQCSLPLVLIIVISLFITIWVLLYFYRVSSKHFIFIHIYNTGYATWVTLESRQHNSGVDQSFPVFVQSGFILQSFFLHSYFNFISACFLTSLDLNPPSELPLLKIFSILMVEETGVPGGNHRYVVCAENPFYTVQHI